MAVDVIIDPSSGQIYWNDAAGSGTQTIAISGNATNAINIVGYSNFFAPGGSGIGTQILATFNDSATSTFVPGTNAYDLGSSSLRWNFYGTGGNFTGDISTSSSTASTSSTTGALIVSGGAGIAKTSYFGQSVVIQGTTASTTPTTGALVVTGGVGISGRLNVGSRAHTYSNPPYAEVLAGFATSFNGLAAVVIENLRPGDGIFSSLILKNPGGNGIISYMHYPGFGMTTLNFNNSSGGMGFYTDGGLYSFNNGPVSIDPNDQPASTSTTTGSLIVFGGAGIAKTSYFGQSVVIQGSTASGSTTTGALIVTGGVGIGGSLQVFGTIDVADNIEVLSQKEVRFFNSANTFYTGLRAGSSSANVTFTLPVADGSANQVLYTNGSAGLAWTSIASVSAITSLNGLTASTQTFATGTSGTDFNISSATSTHTFNIPYAGAASTGLITTQAQTIAGAKTFSSQTIVSDTTTSTTTATGALLVYGGLGVSGQINSASLVTSGNAVVNGNLQFKGTGTFGDATTDTITSLARYASDLLPSTDNSYDLGNNSLGWRNFRVSGVGTIASLAVTSSTVSTSSTTGALRVSGGAGIALTSYFGQDVKILGSTASTSSYTGSLTVAGGVGISGGLYIGVDAPNVFGQEAIGIGGSNAQITLKNTYNGPDSKATQIVFINNGDFLGSIGIGQTYDTSPNQLTINNEYDINYYAYGTNSIHKFTSPLDIELTIGGTGVSVLNTTASNSTTTGALTVSGGAGIAKTSYFGQDVKILGTTASTNTTTGALTVSGGVGIGGSLWTSTSNLASISGVTLNNGTITGTLSGTATSAQVLATTTDTSSTLYVLGSRSSTGFGGTAVYVDTNISFSGSTITASLTGTATTATAAIGVNVSNAATNSTHYIRFSPTATGSGLATSSDTDLTYNPSTNILTAGTFSGAHTGNLTGNVTGTASIATSSVNSSTTTDATNTLYILGSRSSTGIASTALYVDSNISISGVRILTGVWTGTAISAVNGGTGQVSYAVGDILYASSTTALSKLTAGTAGSVLASGGAGAAPYWKADATGAGGAPGGSTSHIQFNNGGSFGGTSFLTYNGNGNNDFIVSTPYSSSTQAQINIGLGATSFDGVTLGKFAGSANGTIIGVNHASGFTGNFADFQLAGSSKFTIGYDGKVTIVGAFSLPTTAGTAGSILTSNGSGNQLYWSAPSSGGGAGTVAAPTAASLVAYYPGTGASVASYNRVEINTATASMELTAQSSLPALVVNAVNGSIADSVEFKSSFGDVYWAVSSNTQLLKSTNGGILKIDGSGAITITNPGSLYFYNSAESFSLNFVAAPTANVTYTLPPAAPATGTSVLQSNTTGTLSWVPMSAGSGSGTVSSGTGGSVAFYTGTGTTVGGAPGFTYTTAGTASTVNIFGGGTAGTYLFTVQAYSATSVRVGIGTNLPQYELEINGEISATNKSFVIDHPTKPGKKLRYGSLEGPENGVYVRGELKDSNVIETPDHWKGLVHSDSFTVSLTPIGRFSHLYVEKIEDYKVLIADAYMNPIHCYYTVWAERKDIPKLITEY